MLFILSALPGAKKNGTGPAPEGGVAVDDSWVHLGNYPPADDLSRVDLRGGGASDFDTDPASSRAGIDPALRGGSDPASGAPAPEAAPKASGFDMSSLLTKMKDYAVEHKGSFIGAIAMGVATYGFSKLMSNDPSPSAAQATDPAQKAAAQEDRPGFFPRLMDKGFAFGGAAVGLGAGALLGAAVGQPLLGAAIGAIGGWGVGELLWDPKNNLSSASGLALGAVGGVMGAAKGMAIGASLGSVVPGVGTFLGGVGGLIVGGAIGTGAGFVTGRVGGWLLGKITDMF